MVNDEPSSIVRLYSVPRRFDVATLLVVVLAYAVLFGVLRLLQLQPIAIGKVAGFVTCVGVGQALLFGGKRPRSSSVLVGVVCLVGLYLIHGLSGDTSLFEFHHLILRIWLFIAIAGGILGYFAGVAIGLVFLSSHVMKNSLRQRRAGEDDSGQG